MDSSHQSNKRDLLERYKHLVVIEASSLATSGDITYKRRCNSCGIQPDNGLECSWGPNKAFFCRICAFTKHEAIKRFATLMISRAYRTRTKARHG